MLKGAEFSYSSVEQYINAQPVKAALVLTKLRNTIWQFLPEGEEGINYQIPTIKYKGKYLIAYAACKEHYKVYIMSVKLMNIIAKDIRRFNTSDVTFQVTFSQTLSTGLIKKVLGVRKKEIELLIMHQ